jgi:hypothetical protein
MSPLSIRRILAAVNEPFPKGFNQMFDLPEIFIIPLLLPSKKGMKAMVEIVIPLSIQAKASLLGRIDDPDVVKIAFSNHPDKTTQFPCLLVNGFPDVEKDVPGTEIEDTVDRVDSKTVHMIFRHPVKGIIDDEVPDLIALRAIEVDRRTPWGFVTIGEIGSVIGKIVPLRPQMVVDHIENDS